MTPEVAGLLAHARGKLEAARVLLEARAPGDAASRAYAAFHAVSAALLARGQDAQRIVDAIAEHLSR